MRLGEATARSCPPTFRHTHHRLPRLMRLERAGAAVVEEEVVAADAADAAAPEPARRKTCRPVKVGYTYGAQQHRFVWGTCYAAHVATFDEVSGLRRSVSPWMHTLDSDPVGLKYRCQWSPPLAIDWFDNSVYFGCQVLFRTRTAGRRGRSSARICRPAIRAGSGSPAAWSATTSGSSRRADLGDRASRTQKGVVWVGTNDGKVWISRDAGVKWTDLTANVKMPKWGLVAASTRRTSIPAPPTWRSTITSSTTAIRSWPRRRIRPDVDADRRDAAQRASARLHAGDRREPASQGDGLRRHRPRVLLLARRRQDVDAVQGQAAGGAGELDRGAEERGGSRRRDLRPRDLDPPRCLAARAGGPGEQQAELQLYSRVPAIRTAEGGQASFVFALKSAPASPITVEVLDGSGAVINTSQVHGAGRVERGVVEPAAIRRPIGSCCDRSLPTIRTSGKQGRWQGRERPVDHWGSAR